MHARPTAPAHVRMAALVNLEKVIVVAEMEVAFVSFTILPTYASRASLISVAIFPSLSRLHLLVRVIDAKLPWHPSGRGRRSSLGKRTKRVKALNARGEDLWRDKANKRVSSRTFLKAREASLGNQRRLTGTL